MKEAFSAKLHLSVENTRRLVGINKIIEEYAAEGYILTLRQLFYQLVSRDVVPNSQKEYSKLSDLLVKGRMAGVVDWDAIEDRVRRPFIPYSVYDMQHAVQDTIDQYRLDRQEGQQVYIECWCEKDALSGVLRRITSHYHVQLCVNRGYTSCSAIYDSYKRLNEAVLDGRRAIILYLGDHDPSGLDMVRDIHSRLEEFGLMYSDREDEGSDEEQTFCIKHIALTDEQIEKYNPPPNPAKFSDPRAKDYVARYGRTSWEVDALPPHVLNALIKKSIESVIDMDLFNEVIRREEHDKKRLQTLMKHV